MILLVEDDKAISDALIEYLALEGFHAELAATKTEALISLSKNKYELLIVDVSLPDGSGFDVCKEAVKKEEPVIFLTASGDERSVVKGFDSGAYDYIAKPFRPLELVSRIKSVLRRAGTRSIVEVADLTVDMDKGTVQKQGKEIELSALEYRLLVLFIN